MKKNLFRSFFADAPDDTEDRIKFIQKRVQIVQKYIPALNGAVTDYANKELAVTACGDKIASVLEEYAKSENVTTTAKEQLAEFAGILYEIGGKRNNRVRSMEANVLQELSEYGKLCKNIQSELKNSAIARDRERIRLRQLKRARSDHAEDRLQISAAEAEYLKARTDSSKCTRNLEEQIDVFERRRLNGLRQCLLSWTVAELRFHARALELFTDAYNVAARINVETDMEEFRNKMRMEITPRLDSSRDTSFQRSDSLLQLLAMPFHRSGERLTGVGIPHPSPSRMSSAVFDVNESNGSCIF